MSQVRSIIVGPEVAVAGGDGPRLVVYTRTLTGGMGGDGQVRELGAAAIGSSERGRHRFLILVGVTAVMLDLVRCGFATIVPFISTAGDC